MNLIERFYNKVTLQKIKMESILQFDNPPIYSDSDKLFSKLQSRYPPLFGYEYDHFSLWNRAKDRVDYLFKVLPVLKIKGQNVLDAGCGDATLPILLNTYGHNTDLVDVEDWRVDDAKALKLYQTNLENLSEIKDNSYDVAVSYNTFEHVKDPQKSLDELIRVLKPGGYLYLHFGPLYCSPWGLHAYRTIYFPFPQFIFSEKFILNKLNELGINDLGKSSNELQPLNKYRVKDFRTIFDREDIESILFNLIPAKNYDDIIFSNKSAFQGRNLTIEDISTQALEILVRKKKEDHQNRKANSFSETYNEKYKGNYRQKLNGYEKARYSALRKFTNEFVTSKGNIKTILDYGSGRGLYMPLWKELFPYAKITACDVSKVALEKLRDDFPYENYETLEMVNNKLPSGIHEKFDLIFSVEVMEHVENLNDYLQDIYKALKPQGYFIWTTPCANPYSIDDIYTKLTRQVEKSRTNERRWKWEEPTHLRRLTSREAKSALVNSGFRNVKFAFRAHLFSFLVTYSPLKKLPPEIKPLLLNLDYNLFSKFNNGASMIGIARKPLKKLIPHE